MALAVVAAFGCAAVGTPAAEDESELAERAADPAKTAAGAPAVPQDEAQSAVTDEDFEEEMIASGRASGLAWRLFTLSAEPAQFLCLEVEGRPSFECAAALVSSWNPSGGSASSEVTLPPTLSAGDPAFVFGALGSPVASVVVELEVGEPVEAEVVGEDKSHYLAVVPPDTTPIHVVLYGPHGQELGRLDFMGDESGEGSWVDSWEQECGPTDDGGYACEGRASGGGYVSRTGGIEGYDETRP